MEVYPFHHQNLFFSIITDYDLTFKEVRGILDHLLKNNAFAGEEGDLEDGKFYEIRLETVRYEVDVRGYEVVIYRRSDINE